jgi:hypothetical protein
MKQHIFVFLGFVILTLFLTYPVAFHVTGSLAGGLGDPGVITWTLSRNIHKLSAGMGDFFDANIFFPHKNTLAYSEDYIGTSIFAFPVMKLTGNPVFTYNLMFLCSFVLSGFFMYLLCFYFTKNKFAGVVSGIIFAFMPFKFDHICHLHLLSSQWMPLTFLCLHKFFDRKDYRYLLLSCGFFILQSLFCRQYFLYLYFFVGLYFIFEVSRKGNFLNLQVWLRLFIFCLITSAVLIPSFLPYVKIKNALGLSRSLLDARYYSANITSYLSVPLTNLVWSFLNKHFWKPEGNLFPGLAAFVLCLAGIFYKLIRSNTASPIKLKFYLLCMVLAFVFSLGPEIYLGRLHVGAGPFIFLYRYLPGFDGVRVPSRFFIMFSLSLALFAGFGICYIKRKSLKIAITALIIVEYISLPLGTVSVETNKNNIPEVYRWLSGQGENFTIMELPVPLQMDMWKQNIEYMYFSIYHRKNLVNGFSSYFPPEFESLAYIAEKEFPSDRSLDVFSYFKIKYIIIHSDKYPGKKWGKMKEKIKLYPDRLMLIKQYDSDFVYVLNARGSLADGQFSYFTMYLDSYPDRNSSDLKNNLAGFNRLFYFNKSELNFQAEFASDNFFCKYYGWAGAEDWGCWGVGEESILTLYFPEDAPKRMTVEWAPPPNDTQGSQKVKIYLNGSFLQEYNFKSKDYWNTEKNCFNFEACAVEIPGVLLNHKLEELKFVYDHYHRMRSRYDSRKLSAGFKTIKFSY